MKRLCLILAAVAMILITACGTREAVAERVTNVYASKILDVPEPDPRLIALSEDRIMAANASEGNTRFECYDFAGEPTGSLDIPMIAECFAILPDGGIIVSCYDKSGKWTCRRVDKSVGRLSGTMELPTGLDLRSCTLKSGGGYEIYIDDGDLLWGYDNGELVPLCSWINSDIIRSAGRSAL